MKLDHVVHVVADLEAAADAFRRLGFHVVPGGAHPHWGTHNALIYFDDLTYIELVAVQDRSVAVDSDFGAGVLSALSAGGGPATVALTPADIARAAAQLQERGLPVAGPQPGSRRRPDGSVVAWQIALPPWPHPFLIAWEQAEAERRLDLQARGALAVHPLAPGLRLDRVAWAVADLAGAAADMAFMYGLTVAEPHPDEELNARAAATDGGILLCTPMGPGPVQDRLNRRGEGPFLYDLTAPGAATRLIAPGEASGAWLRLSGGGEGGR